MAQPNWWFVRERPKAQHPDVYMLVLVPPSGAPQFFILSRDEMVAEMEEYRRTHEHFNPSGAGIAWMTGLPYADRWNALPK